MKPSRIAILASIAIAAPGVGGAIGTSWSVPLGVVCGLISAAVTMHLVAWHNISQYRHTVRRILRGQFPPLSRVPRDKEH